jgi:hypothetical protein
VSALRPEVEPSRPPAGTLERLVLSLALVVLAAAASFAVVQHARRDSHHDEARPSPPAEHAP